jgi:hypothetical protein
MPMKIKKEPSSQGRSRQSAPGAGKGVKSGELPQDLASLIRGLYVRVARKLGVDPSFVSRVARRERRSKNVEDALRRELARILKIIDKRDRVVPEASRAKKTKTNKQDGSD